MDRTSLFLDEATLKRVRRLAKARGVSVAAIVREALAVYLAEPVAEQVMPSIAGRFASGHSDTASRADELLWDDPHR